MHIDSSSEVGDFSSLTSSGVGDEAGDDDENEDGAEGADVDDAPAKKTNSRSVFVEFIGTNYKAGFASVEKFNWIFSFEENKKNRFNDLLTFSFEENSKNKFKDLWGLVIGAPDSCVTLDAPFDIDQEIAQIIIQGNAQNIARHLLT